MALDRSINIIDYSYALFCVAIFNMKDYEGFYKIL